MAERIKTIKDLAHEADARRMLEGAQGGLTEKESRFVSEYVKDLDAGAAWVRSGYSEKTKNKVYALLAKPNVEHAIQSQLRERRAKEKLSTALVVKAFLRIAHAAEAEANWGNALRAWENLARYLGMFVERQESNITVEERAAGSMEEMTNNIKRLFAQQTGRTKPVTPQ